MTTSVTAYIGLGSNIGDRRCNLAQAIDRLQAHPDIRLDRRSSIYETKPVGFAEQPDFLNMVIRVTTTLAPDQLLAALLHVESELGRVRTVRNGPRNIDLDLLLYDQLTHSTAQLEVPHPRMAERAFVLVPLVETMGPHEPGRDRWLTALEHVAGKEEVNLWERIY